MSTPEEINALFALMNAKCAICGVALQPGQDGCCPACHEDLCYTCWKKHACKANATIIAPALETSDDWMSVEKVRENER